ncbi:MAG TPA: NAD(P)-binding domain-containing protein [Acidimicrobiales bacterium]|nr:NAD(P)-binding domain-containing protein [Acidimicrobiales bacterium]
MGIIGSGNIGSTVARLAVDAGHDVVLSNSRGPGTLRFLATELGPSARAATSKEAAETGELVLVSVPVKAYLSLSGLPLGGKLVMDTGNYYAGRDGQIPQLETRALTDSEYLLSYLPG